jgi:hypothetical protein
MRYTNINVSAIESWEECSEIVDKIERDVWNYTSQSCNELKTAAKNKIKALDKQFDKLIEAA